MLQNALILPNVYTKLGQRESPLCVHDLLINNKLKS